MNNIERRFIDHYAAVRQRCYGMPPLKKKPDPPLVYKPIVLKFVMPDRVGWEAIAAEVCVKHGISWGTMMMPAHIRTGSHKRARWEAWWRLRHEHKMPNGRQPTLQEIATMFDLRDHSTISYGLEQYAVILKRREHDQL